MRVPARVVRFLGGTLLALLLVVPTAAAPGHSGTPSGSLPGTTSASEGGPQESVPLAAQAVADPTPKPSRGFLPLRLEWQIDSTGRALPDEMLNPARQSAFRAFQFEELPPETGMFWFRFQTPLETGESPAAWVLDLNMRVRGQLPDNPRVFFAAPGGADGMKELEALFPGIYPLPGSDKPGHIYIRSIGAPGPAFAPVLREKSTLTVLDSDAQIWVRALLGLCLLLSLARGLLEQREWRMWAGLYVGSILVQVFWGLPGTPGGLVNLMDLPGLLAPGVALLILPHVGRHLMRSRELAPAVDAQLLLLALPGLAFSLVPLIPGYAWTLRFLPLWPLGTLLLLPTLFHAAARNLPGVRRFFLICLFPPLGLAAMLPRPAFSLEPPVPAGLWESFLALLPSIGLCFSAVLIAAVRTPRPTAPSRKNAPRNHPEARLARTGELPLPSASVRRRGEPAERSGLTEEDVSPFETGNAPSTLSASDPLRLDLLEQQLRGPLDTMLNELGTLDQIVISREGRRHLETLAGAARSLALLIGDLPAHTWRPPAASSPSTTFELHQVLREAHDAVADRARDRNLSLSWYAAPHLARYYEGNREKLIRVLTMLAESAVRATERGMVQIRVQRLPESNDPGQLLFTISDTGRGAPPLRRNPMALVRAWELAGPDGGAIAMESGPTGTSVTFSMRLHAVVNDGVRMPPVVRESVPRQRESRFSALRILIASEVPGTRQLLAYYLDELPHEVIEARSAAETLGIYAHSPAALIIFDGDMAEEDIVEAVAGIRAFEGEQNSPLASILALANHEDQADRLRRAGCTHILQKPVSRTQVRQLTLRLAPLPKKRAAATPKTSPDPRPASPAKAQQPANGEAPVMPATDAARPSGPNEEKSKKGWNLLPSLDLLPNLANLPHKGKKHRAEEAPPAPEKVSPSSKPLFSNVGEPRPIPKSRQSGRKADETAKTAVTGRREPSAGRVSAPAVITGGGPADSVEWVGEPMPILKTPHPEQPSPAPRAAREPRPRPVPAGQRTPAPRPVPVSSGVKTERAGESMPGRRSESALSLSSRASSPHPESSCRVSEAERPQEAAALLLPESSPASGEKQRPPTPKRGGLLRAVFSAASSLAMRRQEENTVPSPLPPEASEWVGEPMPIVKPAPAALPVEDSGQTEEGVGEPVALPRPVPAADEQAEAPQTGGRCTEASELQSPRAPEKPLPADTRQTPGLSPGTPDEPEIQRREAAVFDGEIASGDTKAEWEKVPGESPAKPVQPAEHEDAPWGESLAESSGGSGAEPDSGPGPEPRAEKPESEAAQPGEPQGLRMPRRKPSRPQEAHTEELPEWKPIEMPEEMPGSKAVSKPLSLLSMILPEDDAPDEPERREHTNPALDRLPLPGMETPEPEIITLTEQVQEASSDLMDIGEATVRAIVEARAHAGTPSPPSPPSPPSRIPKEDPLYRGGPSGPRGVGSVEKQVTEQSMEQTGGTPEQSPEFPENETAGETEDTDAQFAQLLVDLREAYEAGRRSHEAADMPSMHAAADDLAKAAQALGLRDVSELAAYLDQAAQSGDLDAIHGLLSDIRKAVERNSPPEAPVSTLKM